MINPRDPDHRLRLSRSLQHSYQELDKYARMRANTVQAYLGVSPDSVMWDYSGVNSKYQKSLPKGNLLQMAGLDMQIALAYGEPQYSAVARMPENKGFAEKLKLGLNNMATLLNLGETARKVAADSYFGYGIFKTGIGVLPLSAQQATGLEVGPCVWRVGQGDFLYDIQASSWDEVSYVGDIYSMPVNDAIRLWPQHANRLQEMTDMERLDAPHVLPRPSRFNAAEARVWMIDLYFPQSKSVGTWPIRNSSFGTVADEPIQLMPYTGHWSGVYTVLNHLYSPDELVPVAQAESVKAIHFLFNDILNLTSEQALNAKINPIYQAGSDKDMRKIWDAADRMPVGVTDPSRFSSFEIPGPTQSQTSYMAAMMQLFKQFVPTTDDPQRAPTATQGALVRQSTNAIVAEARRKFNRSLQLVGYQLGHLMMNDDSVFIPASKPLRAGSQVTVDMSWRPSSFDPRPATINDFDIPIEPYSTIYRSPEEQAGQLVSLTGQVIQLCQARASGCPINVEKAVSDLADMHGRPELKDWFEELDPLHQAKAQAGQQASTPRPGVGQYTRTSVSEKTTEGAFAANMNNMGSESETRIE